MPSYQKAHFLLSVADVKQLPPDTGIEVAFAGRSNAGKSSVLNAITHNKKLSRVSKTPGRTQQLNFFVLDCDRRLVDLPGYGYAKAQAATKRQWQMMVDKYIRMRRCLKGLILVMDIRHPLTVLDQQLLSYCHYYQLPVHILLNKADKLSKTAVHKTIEAVAATLTDSSNSVTLQSFSAIKKTGIKELYSVLDRWYEY